MQNHKKIIKECYSLEKELLKYKLHANMVPEKSFNANLRNILSKNKWDILRRAVYEKDSYKCYICGQKNIRLEAHEKWKYIYERSIQKLQDINALCSMCHLNIHLGYAGNKNKKEREELIRHWCNVNGKNKKDFWSYFKNVWALWELKNKFDWVIVDGNSISLENQLSKLILRADLVPENTFKVNLRYVLPKKEWDIIRRFVYNRDNHTCRICKRKNLKINAHEEWSYDYEKGLQKLNNIISLCDLCHLNIHLGFAGGLNNNKREEIKKYWCCVNNKTDEDFKTYLLNIYILSELKNKIKWKVIDCNGNKIDNKTKLEDLKNSLGLEI